MAETHATSVQVKAGEVIVQRLFQVSFSIDLAKVEGLWADRSGERASRTKLANTPAKAVAFDVPPVLLSLGLVEFPVESETIRASAVARLYDFGVIAISLRVPVTDSPWDGYVSLINALDREMGCGEHELWRSLLDKVREPLTTTIIRPFDSDLQEEYLLAIVQEWDSPVDVSSLPERPELIPLLSGESRPLSEGAKKDLLRYKGSYFEDDLVVLTWDRAFVCEPRGDSDVVEVLEMANAQLLEFRYYDELLDDELPRMYDLVEETQRATSILSARKFSQLARKLYTLVAEVTELTERVDNALQVTEDVYLARVYTMAVDSFRVKPVSAAVDRKLSIIKDTYTALFDEASGKRAEWLEIAIVILIIFEVILALLWHI
ncbi:hypothetical protein TSACC_3439 [Terrimicrobium sacchariphilum]|uniref:DUF155 domain-containing protein n=1 Tax=Terrimicrobium sacchariphilum TaxID=690879 RepID=A0A146GFE7_TERSA|nr:hypothetical protein [Terrimicrobium sacchariphilum]GAT35374.1 hypothetical protein TSACC_3439 [Terrimicrobium sacchariphilum]